jgi:hypothetical protein
MRRIIAIWNYRKLLSMAVLSIVVLAGCAGNDDEGDAPTATADSAAAATETPGQELTLNTPTVAASLPPATLSAENGNVITDAQCEALIPDGWVDDGTGQGTTTGGHSFVLFGGTVRSDADWAATVNLIATPSAGFTAASLETTEDSIHVIYADDRGFEFRKRFENRYCDFRVTSHGPAIAPDEQAYWDAVIQSMMPVQP